MVKRHEFLESLDAYMDDSARLADLMRMIRPALSDLARIAKGSDAGDVDAAIDLAAAALADAYMLSVRNGMQAGAEWAGVRCAFADAPGRAEIQAAIDGDAEFLAKAFNQGRRRGRQTLEGTQALCAGKTGGTA